MKQGGLGAGVRGGVGKGCEGPRGKGFRFLKEGL